MRDAQIPVIGGHAGVTILPLFPQCPVGQLVPEDQVADLDKRVQDEGTKLVWHKLQPGLAVADLWICSSQSCALRVKTRGVSVTTLLNADAHSVKCDIMNQTCGDVQPGAS